MRRIFLGLCGTTSMVLLAACGGEEPCEQCGSASAGADDDCTQQCPRAESGGSGGGGLLEGCAEAAITTEVLPPGDWRAYMQLLPGGLRVVNEKVLIALAAVHREEPIDGVLDGARHHFSLVTLDAETLEVEDASVRDLMPETARAEVSGYQGIAWDEAGNIAVGYQWNDNATYKSRVIPISAEGLVLPEVRPWADDPHAANDMPGLYRVDWDGEAFVALGWNNPTLFGARVSPEGELLAPAFEYGYSSMPSASMDFATSTNPASGRTFSFSASYYRTLLVHERDGTIPDWIPDMAGLPINPPGVNDEFAEIPAVVATDDGGAWLAWTQGVGIGYTMYVLRVAHDGTLGEPIEYRVPEGETSFGEWQALTVLSDSRVWITTDTGKRVYNFEIEDGAVVDGPHVLVQEATDPERHHVRTFNLMSAAASNGRYVAYDPGDYDHIRVLKVKPGCEYAADVDLVVE